MNVMTLNINPYLLNSKPNYHHFKHISRLSSIKDIVSNPIIYHKVCNNSIEPSASICHIYRQVSSQTPLRLDNNNSSLVYYIIIIFLLIWWCDSPALRWRSAINAAVSPCIPPNDTC